MAKRPQVGLNCVECGEYYQHRVDCSFALSETATALGNGATGKSVPLVIEQYMVIVQCADETAQTALLTRLSAEGYRCRALIS